MGMSYDAINAVNDFLKFKEQRKGLGFDVLVDADPPKGRGVQMESLIDIVEDVGKETFVINFYNDAIRPYIGGYVRMSFAFMKDVKFDGIHLSFVTSNNYVITLT